MGLYRDSQLGLCLDIAGPDGNVFVILGVARNLAKQLDCLEEWNGTVKAVKLMGGGYMAIVNAFETFFPVVTLIGKEEVERVHSPED